MGLGRNNTVLVSSLLWVITSNLMIALFAFAQNVVFFYQIQEDIALECSTAIIELLTRDVSQETGRLDLEF